MILDKRLRAGIHISIYPSIHPVGIGVGGRVRGGGVCIVSIAIFCMAILYWYRIINYKGSSHLVEGNLSATSCTLTWTDCGHSQRNFRRLVNDRCLFINAEWVFINECNSRGFDSIDCNYLPVLIAALPETACPWFKHRLVTNSVKWQHLWQVLVAVMVALHNSKKEKQLKCNTNKYNFKDIISSWKKIVVYIVTVLSISQNVKNGRFPQLPSIHFHFNTSSQG